SLLPGDPEGASALLRKEEANLTGLLPEDLLGRLTAERKRVVKARLEAADKERAALQGQKTFAGIERLPERLAAGGGKGGEAVGARDDWQRFQTSCAVAFVGGEVEKADELLRKNDFTAASTHLRQVASDRAPLLQLKPVHDLVRDARRRVVRARLEAAVKER